MRMRTKMWIISRLHNLCSYFAQGVIEFVTASIECFYSTLEEISKGFYSFSYSHHRSWCERNMDRKTRTSYIRDGYGRRYKVMSPKTKSFDPINYRPFFRMNRKRSYRILIVFSHGIIPIVSVRPHGGKAP